LITDGERRVFSRVPQTTCTLDLLTTDTMAAVDMVIPMLRIPMGIGMGRDCDESPWACGNSVRIFDWVEIKRKCVKYAINVIVGV